MSIPNDKDVEEAQRWGRSLILNGLLIVILVSFTSLDLTEMLIILSVAIAMIWAAFACVAFLVMLSVTFQTQRKKSIMTDELKSKISSEQKQQDIEKETYYKDVAGFIVFIAIVLIAYYVASSTTQG